MARPRRDPSEPDPQLVGFGKALRRARRGAKLSQQALADLSRISQGEISVLEAGTREPGLLTVVYLARALHLKPEDLVKDLR
jgi:transcriptional regulator with XRE-family HTH domain